MKTRNGVCYDLNVSDYKMTVDNLTFVFSSKLHMTNFTKKYKENRDIINYSLSRRFNLPVNVDELADVVLYKKIETRGFLIMTNEGNKLCQKSLKCGGLKVTAKDYSK